MVKTMIGWKPTSGIHNQKMNEQNPPVHVCRRAVLKLYRCDEWCTTCDAQKKRHSWLVR